MDLQRKVERQSNEIINLIESLNKKDKSLIDFTLSIFKINNCLKNNFTRIERKNIAKNFTLIFIFKNFIIKNKNIEKLIEKDRIPNEIVKEFESYINIDKSKVKDEIFRQDNIVPTKNSKLDIWIKKEFVSKIRNYIRGVVGYKVHARYASNNGNLRNSERFKFTFSNLHWDYALNAMPYVIYLSDVKKGDGEFKFLKSSQDFKQNLYLSYFDYLLSNKNGINNSLMSNRVGSHLDNKLKEDIEKDIIHFEGEKGTSIFFAGRYILHCGGYPEINNSRLSVFLSHKNLFMAIVKKAIKVIDFL